MFDIIAEHRRRIADQLEQLEPDQWEQASRCDGWTIRQVAAHLTTGWNVSLPKFMLGIIRARGNFDRANAAFGRQLGERPPDQIIADLRANAEHRFTPPGAGPEAPLADCLLHAHDMFHPLGIDYEIDPRVAVRVMDMATDPKTARITGTTVVSDFALRATDVDWSHENPGKPTIEAPVFELLEAIFGRRHLTPL